MSPKESKAKAIVECMENTVAALVKCADELVAAQKKQREMSWWRFFGKRRIKRRVFAAHASMAVTPVMGAMHMAAIISQPIPQNEPITTTVSGMYTGMHSLEHLHRKVYPPPARGGGTLPGPDIPALAK